MTVVTTGMVGNNYRFLSDLYANGAGGSFDAVGVHTDTACLLASPDVYYREPDGRVGRFSFTGYREVHDVMAANGDAGKGIWMTEIGWNTGSRKPRSCRDGAVAGTRAEGVDDAHAGPLPHARLPLPARRPVRPRRALVLAPGRRPRRRLRRPPRADPAGRQAQEGLPRDARASATDAASGRRAAAASPTARRRRSRSGAPGDGALLTSDENLPVRVRARDNPGGVGMRRVELHFNGRLVRTWGRGRVNSSWFGFRKIPFGTHRVVIRALDRAQNGAEQAFTIRKVTPGSFGDRARPRVRWRSVPARGRLAADRRDGQGPRGRGPAQGDAVRGRAAGAGAQARRPVAHARLACACAAGTA